MLLHIHGPGFHRVFPIRDAGEFKEENVTRGGDPENPGRFSKSPGGGAKTEKPKAAKKEPEAKAEREKPTPEPAPAAPKGRAGVESFQAAPAEGQLEKAVAAGQKADAEAGLPQKKPGKSGEVNPLPMPKDYAVRLNRKLNRKPGVGAPNNAATEVAPGVWVGDINLDQWTARTENILNDEQIDQARTWYEDALPVYESYFGKEKGAAMLGAWLIANQNATPSFAQLSAVRTLEQYLNRTPEFSAQKQGGLAHNKLLQYWESIVTNDPSKMPETGQKIYDFVDAAIGKDTRTFYGDDPRAGAPAVADVHSLRDMGYVDEASVNWVRQNYGDEAADRLAKDAFEGGPSETQYEWAADKMRRFTDELNQRNYKGGGWTPAQLQAVGWTAMSKQLGRMAQTPEEAITGNIRNLSYELDFGEGAPYNEQFPEWKTLSSEQKTAVGQAVLPKILDAAKSIAGAAEFGRLEGLGGWHEYTNAAFKSRLVASPEVAGDVADVIGYLAQQTKVFGYKYQSSGNRPGLAIYSEALRDPATAQKVWNRIIEEQPDLAAGFSPSIHPDGTYGIEILSDKGGKVAERRLEQQLEPAIDRIARELNIHVDTDRFRANEESREHDWKADPTGGGYTSRLAARYGPQISQRLELFKRQELEPAIVSAIAEARGAGGTAARGEADHQTVGDRRSRWRLWRQLRGAGYLAAQRHRPKFRLHIHGPGFYRALSFGDAFKEENVKRGGNPENRGQFSKQAGGGGAKAAPAPKAAPSVAPASAAGAIKTGSRVAWQSREDGKLHLGTVREVTGQRAVVESTSYVRRRGKLTPKTERWSVDLEDLQLQGEPAPSGAPAPAAGAERQQQIRNKATAIVEKLGYDPKRLEFDDGDSPFVLNGKKLYAAGEAYNSGLQKGLIKLYSKHIRPESVAGVTAHETMHQKFLAIARDDYDSEASGIVEWLSEHGQPATVNNIDKVLAGKRPFAKKDQAEFTRRFPTYAAIHPNYKGEARKELISNDGVTNYSREYWEQYNKDKGNPNFELAVNETLAEIAHLEETGEKPIRAESGPVPRVAPLFPDTLARYGIKLQHQDEDGKQYYDTDDGDIAIEIEPPKTKYDRSTWHYYNSKTGAEAHGDDVYDLEDEIEKTGRKRGELPPEWQPPPDPGPKAKIAGVWRSLYDAVNKLYKERYWGGTGRIEQWPGLAQEHLKETA